MPPFRITPEFDCCFCTDTVAGWQCIFASPEFFEAIIDSFKYCRKEKGLRIHGYVIMPNHVRKGYVARPEDWLYSSARNYTSGDNSIIEIDEMGDESESAGVSESGL